MTQCVCTGAVTWLTGRLERWITGLVRQIVDVGRGLLRWIHGLRWWIDGLLR